MPFLDVGDAQLHYEVSGPRAGEPVVLIMGLGVDMSGWDAMMPYLTNFRVLRLDNRGSGSSDSPDKAYSIPGMARDVMAVMDAVGMGDAHVYGASLGSMVAQEIALSHPQRVRTLTLGCPSPGVVAMPGSPGILRLLMTRQRYTREAAAQLSAPYLFHRALNDPKALAKALQMREEMPVNLVGFRRQLQAVLRWSSLARLPFLRKPTLIIHGDSDRLIPTINGRLIAALVRGSRLHIIKGAGHVYSVDAPGEASKVFLRFLADHGAPPRVTE